MFKLPVNWMLVVAGALRCPSRGWLLHKRPMGKEHGGLWEFPGGKVEAGEHPVAALVRELKEELAVEIVPSAVRPAGFAQTGEGQTTAIVLLLYICTSWDGEPAAQEGGEARWFQREEIVPLNLAPLDRELAERLFSHDSPAIP